MLHLISVSYFHNRLCDTPSKKTSQELKKRYLDSLESPDVLPTRRALYNRLREIERGELRIVVVNEKLSFVCTSSLFR